MKLRKRGKVQYRLLDVGDVLRTHPFEGYWGCAVVLTEREKTPEFDPMCHVGVLSAVFTHAYEFAELEAMDLRLGESDVDIRVGVGEYTHLRRSRWIGIYSRKIGPDVDVIG
ncbi:MAG: hypothetical protein GY953_34175, partial [bacterium]|nr:hypothetical protein [bacterium]